MLNPANAKTYTLSFTALGGVSNAVDELGNPEQSERVVKVEAIVSPLSVARLADLAPAAGVDGGGIPVKVRVSSCPDAVRAQQPAVASLTYNGRPATIRLATIREQNPVAAVMAPEIGQSCEGILYYS